MKVEIIDFKPEHLDMMDMRAHEASKEIDGQELFKDSIESKTVLIDGVVLTCYGLYKNNGLWQIPSIHIENLPVKYARATIKIVRKLIENRIGVHTICVDDEFHERWMRFLGFQPTEKRYTIQGCECLLYVKA